MGPCGISGSAAGAESTTKAYGHAIALFLRWCARSGRSWQAGAGQFALFHDVACPWRINVLTAVRGMVVHAVSTGEGRAGLVPLLYEVADDRDLAAPEPGRGRPHGVAGASPARPQQREPETAVDRASDEEIVALLRACRSARDRLIVLLMARAGCVAARRGGCAAVTCTCWWTRGGWGARSPGRICTWCAGRTTRTGRGPSPAGSESCRSLAAVCGFGVAARKHRLDARARRGCLACALGLWGVVHAAASEVMVVVAIGARRSHG